MKEITMSDMNPTLSRANFLNRLDSAWAELTTYLESLSEDQLTQPKDAGGWTAKDHVIHLAAWESAALAMIEGKSKRETLDITPEVWDQDDDPINAVLQQRYQNMPPAEVMQTLRQNHDRLLEKLNAMTDTDFQRPYREYQPASSDERAIIDYIEWDTIHHYGQHLGWIKTLVDQS
jgi:hypothetical protein